MVGDTLLNKALWFFDLGIVVFLKIIVRAFIYLHLGFCELTTQGNLSLTKHLQKEYVWACVSFRAK